jgi:hypothetical protein
MSLQYALTREQIVVYVYRSHITPVYLQHKPNPTDLPNNGLSYMSRYLFHVMKTQIALLHKQFYTAKLNKIQ